MWAALLALRLAVATPATSEEPPPVRASYLFRLSTATGLAASTWASVTYDRAHGETFVLHQGTVSIFNPAGMETHRFSGRKDLSLVSLAVLDDGDLVALGHHDDRSPALVRLDFRGAPLGPFALSGLPQALGPFQPDTVLLRNGRLYFVEKPAMRVVVTDQRGAFLEARDLAALLKLDAKRRAQGGIGGFDVLPDGTLLLSQPAAFAVTLVSPSGEVRSFGRRGSTPGRFNVVGAVTADERGVLFVADQLRSVVMVFDRELRFRGEFGYRGDAEENLVVPYDLAAGNGRLVVSQAGGRGVSVFRYELP